MLHSKFRRTALAVLAILLTVTACNESPEPVAVGAPFNLAPGDSLSLLTAVDTSHARVRRYLNDQIDSLLSQRIAESRVADTLADQLWWFVDMYTRATGLEDLQWRKRYAQKLSPEQASRKRSLDSTFKAAVQYVSISDSRTRLTDYIAKLNALLPQYENLGDSISVAAVHSYLANAYYDDDKPEKADFQVEKCLHLCKALDLCELEGNARLLRAKILSVFQADYAAADRERRAASSCFTRVGLDARRIHSAMYWAYLLQQLYQPRRAIPVLLEAMADCESRDDMINEAYCTNLLAECYYDLVLYDSALVPARRSEKISQQLADSLGTAYYQAKLGYARSTAGLILAAMGQPDQALHRYEVAGTVFEKADDVRGRCLNDGRRAALLLDLGRIDEAENIFRDVLRDSPKFETQVHALYGLATCRFSAGDYQRAIPLLHMCIDRYETARAKLPLLEMRTGMLSDKIGFYQLLAVIRLRQYEADPDPALLDSAVTVIERGRAQTLFEQMAVEAPDLSEQETELINAIGDLQTKSILNDRPDVDLSLLHKLEDSLQQMRMSLATLPATTSGSTESVTVDLIQRSLTAGDIFLEYVISQHGSYVIEIIRDTATVMELKCSQGELGTLVSEYVKLLSVYPQTSDLESDSTTGLGRRLRQMIWPEMQLHGGPRPTYFVAPAGPIHQIPLAAMPGPGHKPMVSHVNFVTVPSFRSLELIRAKAERTQHPVSAAAFGNPVLTEGSDLPPLPFSQTELEAITSVFRERAKIAAGAEATASRLDSVNLETTDVIHFATHALCDPNRPDRSVLVLSYDSAAMRSGFLRPDEIRQLHLNGALVFLSGCRTGDGSLVPGEGVMSLARTFLAAGARSVVATRWSINDRSSAEFAEHFYRSFIGGESPAAALADAQRAMIASPRPLYRHPYFWAAYTLYGDN